MKKILTILTVASLFTAVSASAQAAPAPIVGSDVAVGGGVVPQSCSIDSVTNGTLTLSTPSKLTTLTPGKVKVTCNTTTNKLDIAVNAAASTTYNGTPSAKFTGGTGGYVGATGTQATPGLVNGETANVSATIDSGAAPLQAATNYNVFITPTLTP